MAAHLLGTKIIFQSQGNLDPTLRDTLVFILILVLVIVRALLDDVLRILIESLDIIECPALMSIECLSSHGPDAIDARKFPQNFVLFVFEKGFCDVFSDYRAESRFESPTGFCDLTVFEVLPNLF